MSILRIIDKWLVQPIISFGWRLRNKNCNFTIISNNCWAGGVYQDLKIPYMTPTIGLYFYPNDYIAFLSNLEYYCTSASLTFTNTSKYKSELSKYPIGMLDNSIEIHFLHYESEEEARNKWERRVARINWHNLYVKMDDRDGCTEQEIAAFDSLDFPKKIFFSAYKWPYDSVVYLPKCMGKKCVDELYGNKYLWRFEFDVVDWLN